MLPVSSFYVPDIVQKMNFKEEFKTFKSKMSQKTLENPSKSISLFEYPFLFDPVAKTRIMHIDAMTQMSAKFENAFVNQALLIHTQRFLNDAPMDLNPEMKTATNPYLVLEVRRERLIQDTLTQLQAKKADLKKPLKVKFVGGGEQGLDQGGVQKEFFQVLLDQLMDPHYGMFTYEEESRLCWINGASLEPESHFQLIGIIIGLALYNGVILGVRFPRLIYKKLLGEKVSLEDVTQLFPSLGKGLKQLLNWEEGDVGDIFMRTFEISYDVYGAIKTFPLCNNGQDVIVTNDNRQNYVRLYIRHLIEESVKRQFHAFHDGFYLVCGGIALSMCRSEELELLICGVDSQEMNFVDLEMGAGYDDGYHAHHSLIQAFWTMVHDMTLEQKKKLLIFVTASDRVPLKGLGQLQFIIQRNGPDSDRLPTALTCFGRLLLPEYASAEKMKERVMTAIENAQGFGLT
jgi:ubiquitin-protein ligase E3 A